VPAGSDIKPLCNKGQLTAADVVVTGALNMFGDSGSLVLQRTETKDCRSKRIELAVPRRQESTILAVIDSALCQIVSEGGNRDACQASITFTGDIKGVTVTVGDGRHPLDRVGEELMAAVGAWPVTACVGEKCSKTAYADVQLGTPVKLGVSLKCDQPIVVEPGQEPLCGTIEVAVPVVVEKKAPWLAIGTTAAGVAIMAAGVFFGLQANARSSDIASGYSGARLVPADHAKLNDMRSYALLANVLVGGGALVTAGGGVLFVF
jgi:hypothetical protein